MNAYYQPMHFALPAQPTGWRRAIDTALPGDHAMPARPEPWLQATAPLESRSLMVLVATALLEVPAAQGEELGAEAGGGNRTRIISLEG